jgi:uncharacterized protein YciI
MLALLAGVIAGYGGFIGLHENPQESKMVTLQLVFLRATKDSKPLTKNLHEVYMKRHLDGLKALWESGKAVAIGPMQSSEYEGIVVLSAKDAAEANDLLKDDPFIKSGLMKTDVLPWMLENGFRKGKEFLDVEKIWFGIFERVENAPQYSPEKLKELQAGHLANLGKMANEGILAIAGPLLSNEKRRGIVIFYSKDIGKIKKAISQDPLVRAKRLELKLIPWWTSKGTIVQYKPS